MLKISTKEKQVIKKIVSIGISKAADSFALISKDEVQIDVPELIIIDQKELLKAFSPNKGLQMVILSEIKGDIQGHTLLFFYQEQLVLLEKVCLSFIKTKAKIKDLKTSLMLEISNIITGALVTQLANLLKLNIFGSVPKPPLLPTPANMKNLIGGIAPSNTFVVTIKTSFVKSGKMVSLPFVIVFDLFNMEKILNIIRTDKYKSLYAL